MNDLQELTQKWQEQATFHANTAKKCTDDVADLHAGFAAAYENVIKDLQVIIRKKKYGPPRSKWHRVEDKVVEAGKVYLVRYVGFVENARCTAYRNCAGIWYSDPGGVILKEVTHLRELPKFKEERDA